MGGDEVAESKMRLSGRILEDHPRLSVAITPYDVRFCPSRGLAQGLEPFVQAGVTDSGEEPVGCAEVLFENGQYEAGDRDTHQAAGLVIADDQVSGLLRHFKM